MFEDRRQAGQLLAKKLTSFENKSDTVVLGITRGGVIVAKEISVRLSLPLDIIVIKKIGAPQNPELAIGAVGPRNVVYWDQRLCRRLGINSFLRKQQLEIKREERQVLEKLFRAKRKSLSIKNKIVILIDDGVATGATVLCAQKYFKKEKSKEIILAAPVIAKDTFLNIKRYFDNIIVLEKASDLYAIGQFYKEFNQVDNEEVIKTLSKN
ncbi:phosphoribosyltransferase [Patescibacteria group bacterium]|nr:phosphoribosyltransferase [Patescibacteria group bacterium]